MTMRKNFQILLTAAFCFLLVSAFGAERKNDPTRWDKDILQFEAADKTNPPPKKAVLFIGSSSIRLWKSVEQDFPEHKVINRGFGGSQIEDATFFFDRIVKPYKPKMIVMYSGGNDISAGKTPEQVFADFTNFVATTHKTFPRTKIAYISIAPNPARWSQIERVKAANQLIEDFAKKKSKVEYIDTFSAMLGDDGKPKPDIFLKDNLHMNAKGYAIWTPIVRKYLK